MNYLNFSRWSVVWGLGIVIVIALVVVELYLPFSGNPAIFDDHNFITNLEVYDFAQDFFSRKTRTFPYFSIGFVQVLSGGDLAWNRYVSMALHGAVVLALYFFLSRALARVQGVGNSEKR